MFSLSKQKPEKTIVVEVTNTPRKEKASASIWMSRDARKTLKIWCHTRDETMESFMKRAVNSQLAADGADFGIN